MRSANEKWGGFSCLDVFLSSGGVLLSTRGGLKIPWPLYHPYYPNYRLFFRDPIPTLEAKSVWELPYYLHILKRPHPRSYHVFILCAWYTIWVSIPIKSIVLSLFLAFITLSNLYYPHHPPSEGSTFCSQETGILYVYSLAPPPDYELMAYLILPKKSQSQIS